MIKEFLKLGGVATVEEFYKKYPTEDSFFEVFPQAKKLAERAKGGMAEAFPQSMKADKFFSMGYYAPQQPYLFMHGGSHNGYSEVYPQAIPYPARPGAGKFPTLPLNFKAEGGVAEMYPQSPKYLDKPLGGAFLQMGGEDGSKNAEINGFPDNRRDYFVNWLKNKAGSKLSQNLTKENTQYSMDLENSIFQNGGQPDPEMMDAEGMAAAERARRDYDMKMALNDQELKDSFNSLFSLGNAMSYRAPFQAKISRTEAKYGGGPLQKFQQNNGTPGQTGGGSSAGSATGSGTATNPPAGSGASNQTQPEYNYYLTDEEKALVENYKKKQAYRQALYEAYNVEQPFGEGLFAYQPLNQRGTKYAYNRPLATILDTADPNIRFTENNYDPSLLNKLLGRTGVKSRTYYFGQGQAPVAGDSTAPADGSASSTSQGPSAPGTTDQNDILSPRDMRRQKRNELRGIKDETRGLEEEYDNIIRSINRQDKMGRIRERFEPRIQRAQEKLIEAKDRLYTGEPYKEPNLDEKDIYIGSSTKDYNKKRTGGSLKEYQGAFDSGNVDSGFTVKEKYNNMGFNYSGIPAAQFNIAAADTLTGLMERAGYNKQRKKLPDMFSGYNVFAQDRPDRGDWYPLSGQFKPNLQGFKNQYVQYGGSIYQEGGEYFLTQSDIDAIIAMGGEVEFLD